MAGSVPFEIHDRIVAGLQRSSAEISAIVNHGSSGDSGSIFAKYLPQHH
jgi:hypothetical protein